MFAHNSRTPKTPEKALEPLLQSVWNSIHLYTSICATHGETLLKIERHLIAQTNSSGIFLVAEYAYNLGAI